MQVSISAAAKMAGVSRSTFYDHIEEKGISLIDGHTKRPKVDVSELIRVYGDKVKVNDNDTQGDKPSAARSSDTALYAENRTLKEKIELLETERNRERRQLMDQIDNLQESLKKEQEAISKITALLSDQRSTSQKESEKIESQTAERIGLLEQSLDQLLKNQKKRSLWPF